MSSAEAVGKISESVQMESAGYHHPDEQDDCGGDFRDEEGLKEQGGAEKKSAYREADDGKVYSRAGDGRHVLVAAIGYRYYCQEPQGV